RDRASLQYPYCTCHHRHHRGQPSAHRRSSARRRPLCPCDAAAPGRDSGGPPQRGRYGVCRNPLCTMESVELGEARAAFVSALSERTLTERNYRRWKQLFEKGLKTQNEFWVAENEFTRA